MIVQATFGSSDLGVCFLNDTPDLEEILQCPYEDMNMPMLSAALFKQGLLSSHIDWVKHTCDNLGLGDIGYIYGISIITVIESGVLCTYIACQVPCLL